MTTAEIKALIPQLKYCIEGDVYAEVPVEIHRLSVDAIENLLARQAEVLEEIMFDYSLHSENVRAILNPENEE